MLVFIVKLFFGKDKIALVDTVKVPFVPELLVSKDVNSAFYGAPDLHAECRSYETRIADAGDLLAGLAGNDILDGGAGRVGPDRQRHGLLRADGRQPRRQHLGVRHPRGKDGQLRLALARPAVPGCVQHHQQPRVGDHQPRDRPRLSEAIGDSRAGHRSESRLRNGEGFA